MQPGRLLGLDLARCLALLGMVAVHVLPADSWGHDLAHGRAAALFAVLLGVTVSFLSRRDGAVAGLAVRGVLIAVLGLVLGELDSGLAVILTYYGLLLLLGLVFLGLRVRALLVVAGAWVVLAPIVSQLVRPALPDRTFEVPSFGSLEHPWQLLTELTFTGYYPAVPWLAYLLVGMAVGRMQLSRRSVDAGMLTAGLALAVVASAASAVLADPADVRAGEAGLFGVTPTDAHWAWLLVDTPHSATPFDLAHTIGTALAVIGAGLLVGGLVRDRTERAVAVLFGAGTMTLTLYSLHVVLRTDLFWPPDDDSGSSFRWHVLVLVWVGALFVALGRRGPLEELVGRAARTASRWASRRRPTARPRP